MLLQPIRANAYRTAADDLGLMEPVRHRAPSVTILVGPVAPYGIEHEELEAAVMAAAAAWNLSCSGVRLIPAGSTSEPASERDGITTVWTVLAGWEERGASAHQAATTDVRYVETAAGWEIADADVLINAETVNWTALDAPDLRAVLVHELGHVLGLAHPCAHEPTGPEPACGAGAGFAAESVMFPDYQPGAREPRGDDVEGLCSLYPPVECTGDAQCPPDQRCDAGRCARACPGTGELCEAGVCAEGGDLEGQCVAPASEGAPCRVGDDCRSRLCLTSMSAGSYCTEACRDDADCAGMQACRALEGRRVCAPLRPASSCAVAPSSSGAGLLAGLLALCACIVARARRSNRASEVKKDKQSCSGA